MNDLHQYSLGRVVNNGATRSKRPLNGSSNGTANGTTSGQRAHQPVISPRFVKGDSGAFTPSVDKLIVRAFEDTREGFPLERVLADPLHAGRTLRRARILGVDARDHEILLRLFRIRKSPRQKIRLAAPTVKEPRREHAEYAFAAEIALSQMKYRFGASVDDILAYPQVGGEFDELCQKIHPGISTVDYRLAALHIRKSRYCDESERSLFESLSEKKANQSLTRLGTLDKIDLRKYEGAKGIVSLVEETHQTRCLYMTGTSNVAETVLPFTRAKTLRAVENPFWSPVLSLIHVDLYDIPKDLQNANLSLWAKRLISLKTPLFNHPIRIAGRSAE
ncbi:MAG: hypothetical protein U0798_15605 [Gemmataceae bacterium]